MVNDSSYEPSGRGRDRRGRDLIQLRKGQLRINAHTCDLALEFREEGLRAGGLAGGVLINAHHDDSRWSWPYNALAKLQRNHIRVVRRSRATIR